MPKKVPSYRQRSNSNCAIVTLTDSVTKRRRDYWLGDFGTPASRELYYRLLSEWGTRGRRLPRLPDRRTDASGGITIRQVNRVQNDPRGGRSE